MSAEDDNIFARWSRRKRAARSDEAPALAEEQDAEAPPQTVAEPGDQEADAAAENEPLPDLDELTAESDLTAFLRKGVPAALRKAALRKMWSLDPSIRDYIGPSEYAWDFNKPDSIAGFGTLDPEQAVVAFLSRTARAIEPDAEPTAAVQPADASAQPASVPQDAATAAEVPEPTSVAETTEPEPSAGVENTPEATSGEAGPANHRDSPDTIQHSRSSEPIARPRHGGAMPR